MLTCHPQDTAQNKKGEAVMASPL